MKHTSMDRQRTALLAALGIVILSWFGGTGALTRKTRQLEAERLTLEEEYGRRRNVLEERDAYERAAKDCLESYDRMRENLSGELTQENQILFAAELERRFDMKILSLSCLDITAVEELQVPDDETGRALELLCRPVQMSVRMERSQWEEFLKFIAAYPGKSVVSQVSARIDDGAGMVDASLTLSRYAIAEREADERDEASHEK